MALAWEGFDVDLIPQGQPLTAADLEDVGIVVLLPTLDYPGSNETWSEQEIALLDAYTVGGGFLLVTNSAYSLSMNRHVEDMNEDSRAINALLEPMGISFKVSFLTSEILNTNGDHALVAGAEYLTMFA